MAEFNKTGARTPLAIGRLGWSWSRTYLAGSALGPETYRLSLQATETDGGKSRYCSLLLNTKEAVSVAVYIAQRVSRKEGEHGLYNRISDADALRALATILDGEPPACSDFKR